jgi:hypothetical protein
MAAAARFILHANILLPMTMTTTTTTTATRNVELTN